VLEIVFFPEYGRFERGKRALVEVGKTRSEDFNTVSEFTWGLDI
jgi:hypothetical protein